MSNSLSDVLRRASELPLTPAAFIHPTHPVVLQSALQARAAHIVEPVLVGPAHKIQAAAKQAQLDISNLQVVDTPHSHAAVEQSAALVHEGKVDVLVKGSVPTDELMGVLVRKEEKMRTERRMSHVFVIETERYHKLLCITDAALNVLPDLLTKRDIVQNAIDLTHALGIDLPKVGILSAQENVKPRIPSTIDAAALCKMVDRKQIYGALLDGPLAFDNAISKEAAEMKGIESEVAGDADILLAPNLEAGNMLAKQLTYLAESESAGLVMGCRVPIVLTSRAEKEKGRLHSIALGALVAAHQKSNTQKPYK